MAQYLVGVGASLVLLLFVVEMLRRGIVAEKFAALWLIVALGLVLFAIFPGALRWLAEALGFALPSNLLFALAGLLLLAVSVQLSHEVGRLDVQSRRLAQELALLRHDVEALQIGPLAPSNDVAESRTCKLDSPAATEQHGAGGEPPNGHEPA